MASTEVQDEKARLKELGWTERPTGRTGKIVLEHPLYGIHPLPLTPSDHRWLKNSRREVAHKMGLTLKDLERAMGIAPPKGSGNGRKSGPSTAPRQRFYGAPRPTPPEHDPKKSEPENARIRREWEEQQAQVRLHGPIVPTSVTASGPIGLPYSSPDQVPGRSAPDRAKRFGIVKLIHESGGRATTAQITEQFFNDRGGALDVLKRMRRDGLLDWVNPPVRSKQTVWKLAAKLPVRKPGELTRRRKSKPSLKKTCPVCDTEFKAKRVSATYCSPHCRSRAYTRRGTDRPIADREVYAARYAAKTDTLVLLRRLAELSRQQAEVLDELAEGLADG